MFLLFSFRTYCKVMKLLSLNRMISLFRFLSCSENLPEGFPRFLPAYVLGRLAVFLSSLWVYFPAAPVVSFTTTGLGISMCLPVSFSMPVSGSLWYTSMRLASLQQASRNFPLGVMAKLRGCAPVFWYPMWVKRPVAESTWKIAIPSAFRRLEAYRYLPSGERWMSALPLAPTLSACMLCICFSSPSS